MSHRLTVLRDHLQPNKFVNITRRGDIGYISLRRTAPRPAVQAALSSKMRAALLRALCDLQRDETVKGIVICGDNRRLFSSGLNKDNFADGLYAAESIPSLAQLNDAIELSSKVVVAFVQGQCASWGLELCMSTYKCIATPNSRFSFPEVSLGIVPCGGGAQRLTRLVGVRQALKMLCSGRVVSAAEAQHLGLINDVLEASTAEATMLLVDQYVHSCVAEHQKVTAAAVSTATPYVPRGRRTDQVGTLISNWVSFAWMRHKISENVSSHLRSPYWCLDAVQSAVEHIDDFSKGVLAEQQLLQRCLQEPTCQGTQHAMKASERTLQLWEMRHSLPPSQYFRHVAVLGAGTMGTSIAYLLLQNGLRVTLVEIDTARRAALLTNLREELTVAVERERLLTPAQAQELQSRIAIVGSYTDPFPAVLSTVDLVLECVPESIEIKKNVFMHLDNICSRNCVFATCSSAMDVNKLASMTRRPQLVLGLNLYPPANETLMAEVTRGALTEERVVRRILGLADHLRKHVIISQGATGHIGTRLLLAGLYQGYAMLEDGSFPYDIDKALKRNFHFFLGIFEIEDLIGLDAMAMARSVLVEVLPSRPVYDVVDDLVRDGLYGRKRGEGWYRYKETSRDTSANRGAAFPVASAALNPFTWRNSPLVARGSHIMTLSLENMKPSHSGNVEHRVLQNSSRKSIMRRDMSEQEMVERVVLSMINEAAKLLETGVASCASDVDCLSVNGFGFPAWKGGLLYYADNILGIDKVINRLHTYHRSLADAFPPVCGTLMRMQKNGLRFSEAFPDQKMQ